MDRYKIFNERYKYYLVWYSAATAYKLAVRDAKIASQK